MNVIGGEKSGSVWTALTSITGTDGQSGLYSVTNANWNELENQNTGNSGGTPETLSALKDDTGAATSATVTARLGGWWHLNGTGTEAVRTERQARLGGMGMGFCDPSKVADTKELSIADVPYARYSLVLYYGTNNGGNKYAAPAVTFADDTVKTYTYAADSTAESATEGTGAWGSTTSTATAGETGRYGKDVMRIDGLSGDIEIDLGTQPGTGAAPEAGSLCGFQIIDTTPPPTISVNFIGRNGPTSIKSKSGVSGIVPVNNANWNEGKSDQNANNSVTDMVVVDNQGIATSARVSYSMDGSWVAGTNPERNALLGEMGKGYCDNLKDANKDELCLRDIPYSSYSLILYFGTDKIAENIPWSPVKVTETASGKETWYSYPADYEGEAAQASDVAVGNWGTVSAKTGAFGDDVMLIEQLSGDIDIDLGARVDDGVYGSLCGFQIVCTGEIGEIIGQDESKSGVVSLNFGSNHREVPASDDLYGLAQVPGSAWQNLSGAEGNASIAVVYNTALEQLPVVNYDSATTYWTTKNDTAPFLQGYLDDGATTAPYGATVSVANVPYAAYDVIVYAGYSDSGANNIRPYEVNGTYYTWDAARGATVATTDTTATWGALDATPGYGVNALRVRGLLGGLEDLTVKGLPRNGAKRGGIAALQIVERKLITQADWGAGFADYAADTPVYILATQAVTGDVTLPADTVFDVSYYSGVGPVVDGTLTLSAGTLIRLPSGQSSVKLANTLTVSGGEAASLAFIVNGVWRTDITVDATTGTVTIPLDYKWVGSSMNDNWSNPVNWSSGIVPGAEDAVEIPVDGATNIVLDTVAAVGALTISGPTATGTGAATLALSAQGDGALTVSGQMLTTGNVAVTQNANITVKGATSRVSGTGTSFDGQRGQAGFHVNQATYTVASGATLTIPATEGVSDTGELSMSNGATVTVAEGATVVADSARVTYYGGTPSGGSLNLGGTATFTQTLTLNTGNYTVNLTGGTLTTPSVSTYATGMVVSGNATLAGARTIRAIGANPSALSGAGNLTLNGTITFETPIGATYTGEITVADGASVSLGESRPKLTTVGTAQVSVTPSVEEQTQGQIVFSTSMTALPEGATFMVAGVTEQVSAIVANGEKCKCFCAGDGVRLGMAGIGRSCLRGGGNV